MPDKMVGQNGNGQQEWSACNSGEISGMVRRAKVRRRATFGAQLAGGAMLGLLLGFGFLQLKSTWGDARSDNPIAGITCSEVRQKAQAFRDGTLPKAEHQRVAAHLDECPECAKLVRTKVDTPNGTRRDSNAGRSLSQLPASAPLLATAR